MSRLKLKIFLRSIRINLYPNIKSNINESRIISIKNLKLALEKKTGNLFLFKYLFKNKLINYLDAKNLYLFERQNSKWFIIPLKLPNLKEVVQRI